MFVYFCLHANPCFSGSEAFFFLGARCLVPGYTVTRLLVETQPLFFGSEAFFFCARCPAPGSRLHGYTVTRLLVEAQPLFFGSEAFFSRKNFSSGFSMI
jgi:hypothetical protein